MKYLFALLFVPSVVLADCDSYGLYAFFMGGCPQYGLGVDVGTPLCQQEEWKQYSYLDPRCYVEVPFDFDKPCYSWGCPAPYDRVMQNLSAERLKYFAAHGSSSIRTIERVVWGSLMRWRS